MESLQNNYFNTILKTFDHDADSFENITTKFYPPKIAVVSGRQIRIIDVQTEDTNNVIHETGTAVRFVHLHKHYLWVLSDSPQFVIYDLLNTASLKVNFQNGGFRIKKLRRKNGEAIFVSESGDCFTTSITMSQMTEQMKSAEVSIEMRFVKVRCDITTLETDDHRIGGTSLSLTVENMNTLVAQCRVTGVQISINIAQEISGLATFNDDDRIVLKLKYTTGQSALVLTRLGDSHLETSIDSETPSFPVGGVGDAFYYITENSGCIKLNCVKRHEPLHVARALASCGKYDEAHDYALKNHLDVEPLLKMKVSVLVESVLAGEVVECETFLEILEQINDLEFLVEQTAKLCQHNVMYKPLVLYLRDRATDNGWPSEKLQEIIAKIEILEFSDLRTGCDYVTKSNIFVMTLDNLCKIFVTNGDVDLASFAWLKRCSIVKCVNSDMALEILNATPQQIKLNALMVWLRTFFPEILHEMPFFVDSIVKWAVERVFALERSKYWPDIGLKFTADILAVLADCRRAFTSIQPPSLDTLHLLTVHMNNVKLLKEKYRVNILIRELTVESPTEVVKIILHRCYTEDLKSLMNEYLPRYISRHGLDYDTLLREYVEQLLAAAAVDDARLPLVVQAMYSDEHRVACVLHVIQHIEVPWSDSVYHLAVEASTTDHECSEQIKTQLKYAKLKMVLKKYNFPITWSDYESVLLKVVNASEVDLKDMRTVVEVAGRLRDYANLLYVNRCLHTSTVRSAIDYCNLLEMPEKKTVTRSTLIYMESLLMEESGNSAIERNYMDFLKGMNLLNHLQLNRITSMYHLKNSYGIGVTANDYCIEVQRMFVFTNWCKNNGSNLASNIYYLKSLNLASLLLIERKTAVPIVLTHMKDKFYRGTLQAMLRNSDDLLLENVIENFDMSMFIDGKNSELLESYIDMFTEFTTTCREELLHSSLATLSVLTSIKNCSYFVNNSSIAWKFHYIFMPISTYSSMNDLIIFYQKCNTSNPENLVGSIVQRNDLVPLRILSEISNQCTYTHTPLSSEFVDVREKIAKKMLSKILLSQHCDELLVTSLLYLIPSPDDWLRDLYDSQSSDNTNKSSLLNYMILAEKILGFRDIVPRTATGYHQVLKAKHNLDITDCTCSDENEETCNMKLVMFNILKANLNMGIKCLQDVCRTFNMSLNDGLTLQVLALITTWDLKYHIYRDSLNCKQIDIKNNEQDLLSQCSILLESIKSKEFLIDTLKELWNTGEFSLGGQTISVNPYHYEVYLCIYHLVSRVASDWKVFKEYLLLQFLKQYRRVSSPRQAEMDEFSVKGSFPEIGYYRLPFHLFTKEDTWGNLKYEITLKSYKDWLPIAAILKLDKDIQTSQDMLCSTAVKQTMTQQKLNNESALEQWKLFVTNEGLLKQAHECVMHISNMEWAAACLFYVLQGTRRGADQLAAAELIYHFAQQWSKLQPNNNAVKKMQYKYCTLSTMHILHKMGYTDERFLQLSTDPAMLIRTLYGDKGYADNMLEFDVNKSIDEIADKNGVNIDSIRYQILENILDKKTKRAGDTSAVGLDCNELTRARYILKATCPNMGALYLVRIGLVSESDYNKGKKLRALQCLTSIVDPNTLLKICVQHGVKGQNMERSALQNTLLDLFFSIELERIDMPFIVATFIEDKQRALKQIWHAADKTASTLCVVARMGCVYTLTEEVIQELLPALVRCDLVEELTLLLPHLNCAHTSAFSNAWSKVLLTPFEKADYPVSERQRSKCLSAINLLPRCPTITDTVLQSIWENCVRCKSVELGCLVLPYMSTEQRSNITDWLKVDRRKLIANIKNLHAETFMVIAAMTVVDSLTSRRLLPSV